MAELRGDYSKWQVGVGGGFTRCIRLEAIHLLFMIHGTLHSILPLALEC